MAFDRLKRLIVKCIYYFNKYIMFSSPQENRKICNDVKHLLKLRNEDKWVVIK